MGGSLGYLCFYVDFFVIAPQVYHTGFNMFEVITDVIFQIQVSGQMWTCFVWDLHKLILFLLGYLSLGIYSR